MVLTLWFSKKAKSVAETELSLSRQGDTHDKFEPNRLSRAIVKGSSQLSSYFGVLVPKSLQGKINNSFEKPESIMTKDQSIDAPAFDMIRASVNLMVAGVLIAIATSFKLPLSTTYVTFMVAMGLSVASMIRVGNQKGLQNYKELRRIAFSIFLLGALLATLFAIFFFIFHKSLPNIYMDLNDTKNYIDNMEVVSIAADLLLVAAFFQISDSIQVVFLGALRGLQDVKVPTILTFISYWCVGFPVSYFLGKEDMYGSFGIWLGLLAGLTTASVLLYIRFNTLTLKLIEEKKELVLEN